MIEYSDVVKIDHAKTEGYHEVSYTVRKISHGIRSKIRRQLAPTLAKIREKTEEIENLIREGQLNESVQAQIASSGEIVPLSDDPAEIPGPTEELPVAKTVTAKGNSFTSDQIRIIEKIEDINNEIEIITSNDVDIVYLQHGLVSVDGLKIANNSKPDYKLLYESGPEPLCLEIVERVKEEAGLTMAVKENLKSPTTSGAAAGGPTTDTIAPDVKSLDTIERETVISISQSK